jgi:hypothetical protein
MKHLRVNSGTVHNVARLRGPGRFPNGGLVLIWGVAIAMALCAGVGPLTEVRADPRRTREFTHEGSQAAAEQLLQRAADALGGAGRLRAIDRLHITAVERQSLPPKSAWRRAFKLWLPDRFQSKVEGFVTHTLNGGHLTIDREVAPDVRRTAESATQARFRLMALAFLLRAPGLSAPRVRGDATVNGLRGTLVEFTAPDGRSLELLLAPTSAHPLAIVYPVRVVGSTEQVPDQVWRLEDYRVVDGVRFPFRLTTYPGELIMELQQIEVNPQFTSADFPK